MRRKLNIIFLLITLSLFGIIAFQIYWALNAYAVNKEKFDSNIDVALQRAINDCKKEYLDSLRTVIARRLSPPETRLKLDTITETADHNLKYLYIDSISNLFWQTKDNSLIPFSQLGIYRKKIDHKANLRELIAEAAFNNPVLMHNILQGFSIYDISSHGILGSTISHDKSEMDIPEDRIMKFDPALINTVYALRKDFRETDSIKIVKYLKTELNRLHIRAPFNLIISTSATAPAKLNSHYSETTEYHYKYHGFRMFVNIVGPEFFVRAVIRNPQNAILKGMLITLLMSVLLVVLTVFCFWYIFKTIIQQKKLSELKDDFINNMTHELKTPIATMTVAIEGLQKYNALNDPEKTQRYLQTSRNELTRLNDIVSRVLNVAAFGNDEVKLVKEEINIDELINDVIETEKLKANKPVTIYYENKGDIKTIIADKLHFRNIMVNLLDNAIKYSNEQVLIIITCYKVGDNALLSVKDNGIGIPASHISQVFNKFHRVPTGNVHNVKGTGLGLSYVKYVVEAHGGSVMAESEPNIGSEFIISIPYNQ
ncbi:sensor histidine kinase KdpD [Mucilaginibacter sp. BT774]|uniref:sensor histidine kinase n=1 Tax=Mucilaginibacter sp. BT774 TaxID=3062276 RepID=UPI002674F9DB|nr:HAMP domain-containing sensor histidine kinase [Mucilaginibacter sp. BT774]MDO3625366.1 HAMP domain-containing sensor histidine kinase [Mucilaginibacter sp. BT774]